MAGSIKLNAPAGGSVTLNAVDTASNFVMSVPAAAGVLINADSATGAAQLPVGTTAQRPASPVTGQTRFNTTLGIAESYNGAVWIATSGGIPVSVLVVAGGAGGGYAQGGGGSVCTIPFCTQGAVFGALTLERPPGQVFERQTVELCETIAALIGPILETKRKEDLWLGQKVWLSVTTFFTRLFGPTHGGLKLGVGLLIAVSLFCLLATGDFRIAADTKLEGSIQRVIATPFDSYISEAHVRPGDIVKKDALLAKLDDTELLLERTKWESQKEQYLKEYRDALGQAERSKISVLNAQLGQVDAQLAITDAQLARIQIKAPFDGVIVSGDLSQSLGAPSQRGDVLFELAPLEDYRVVLEVDERDISAIVVAQKGELVLTGLSDTVIPFTVNKITPVSETKEGRNYFRVEAELEKKLDFLRPGMEGVGKIRIGERKLIWIWSKNLLDWLRLSLWTWWPEGL